MRQPDQCGFRMCHNIPVYSSELRRGIELFNRGAFFEAHEVLEDVWRASPEADKKFLQGLTQLAVAFHHHSRGNLAGAGSVLDRAVRNLSQYPDGHHGIGLEDLRQQVDAWKKSLKNGSPGSPPHILMASPDSPQGVSNVAGPPKARSK